MRYALTFLGLAVALALAPLAASSAAQADDRQSLARDLVEKTVAKNLSAGFRQAAAQTLSKIPPDQADTVRTELDRTFEQERRTLVDELSKEYAQKFSEEELRRIGQIYDDPVYQKFQGVNADPNSLASTITKGTVTKLMNLLALTTLSQQKPAETGPPSAKP